MRRIDDKQKSIDDINLKLTKQGDQIEDLSSTVSEVASSIGAIEVSFCIEFYFQHSFIITRLKINSVRDRESNIFFFKTFSRPFQDLSKTIQSFSRLFKIFQDFFQDFSSFFKTFQGFSILFKTLNNIF